MSFRPRLCALSPHVEALEDRCVLSPVMTLYPLPAAANASYGIATDSGGNAWFTEYNANAIGEIDAATHAVHQYAIPTLNSFPFGITRGPDGNLWFTESNASQIGRLNPTTGAIAEVHLPTSFAMPTFITAGPDGNLWFTEAAANRVGVLNPNTGAITELAIPTASSSPGGITAGPDGNLWFTEFGADQIGVVSPTTGAIAELPLPTAGAGPVGIARGADGQLWFAEHNAGQIGAVNPTTGVITEYFVGNALSGPMSVVSGADGNLWFTEQNSNQIGTINVATHIVTQYALPAGGSGPSAIAAGPGGAIWFSEYNGSQVGELFIPPIVTSNPKSTAIDAGQSATFTVTAGASILCAVQWQVSFNGGNTYQSLSNDGTYSGVTTATLTITNAPQSLNGARYRAVLASSLNGGATRASAAATLTVQPDLSFPATLPADTAGVHYSQAIYLVGGVRPMTSVTITGFDGGGTGLTRPAFSFSNGIFVVNGTPTAAGTVSFTLSFTDSTGATLTQAESLTVNPPPSVDVLTQTQWTLGRPGFSGTMAISGGTGPYHVVAFSGLPTGLTPVISGNAIAFTGTPTLVQSFPAGTVTIADAVGAKSTRTFAITINPAITGGPLTTRQWTVGVAGFPGTMNIGGGTGGLTITQATGLPTGLTPIISGNTLTFTGTPSVAGTFATAKIVIQDAVGATYTRLFGAFTISPAPQLGNLTVGQWTVGKSGFTGTLAILRGTGPFSISSISGLPDGMSAALSGRSVVFTGTPTLAQTYAAGSITVADATGTTASQTFTITINPALTLGPLSQTAWIGGKTGYNGTLAIGGGTGPYVITGLAGLAPGLTATISAGAVKFAGMPLQFGKFAGGVTVRDAAGVKVVQTFTITINPPLSAGVLTLNHWAIGVSGYTGTIALHGGCGGNTIVATTGLPPGLTAVVTGQTISFTDVPTATGTYTGSITIQDVIGAVLKVPFTITITAS